MTTVSQTGDRLRAPDFALVDTCGRGIRLSDYRGRPVVLVFLRGLG